MASWGATKAKAQFSGLLTAAEEEGPQLIRRRNQTYVVTTEAEIEKRLEEAKTGKRERFISAWDALRPPFDERFDMELRRDEHGNRWVDFG